MQFSSCRTSMERSPLISHLKGHMWTGLIFIKRTSFVFYTYRFTIQWQFMVMFKANHSHYL